MALAQIRRLYLAAKEMAMTLVEQLAAFVAHTAYDSLSEAARHRLEARVLGALG